MKHYTYINTNIKDNNNFSFRNLFNNPSKSLDDLLLSNIKKMNPFLTKKSTTKYITINDDEGNFLDAAFREAGLKNDEIIISGINDSYLLKGSFDSKFAKAAKFLSNYTPTKKYYSISGDTPIAFFEDEIQIGDYLIPLYKFSSPKYYNTFTPETKKLIINLYISIIR